MKNWIVVGIAFASCLLLPKAGTAEVQFEAATTPDGTVIVAQGDFANGQNFARFERLVQSSKATVVTFNSPGGNTFAAMEFGRLIRSLGLSTVQLRAAECASACALAFMGGVQRFADPGSIGVHRSSFSAEAGMDSRTAVSAIQSATADMITYMIDMGIDPGLLQVALKYDSDDMRYLSSSEMTQYRLTQITAALPRVPVPVPAPARRTEPDQASSVGMAGLVRHPRGQIELKSGPDEATQALARIKNGAPVQIIGDDNGWYVVRYSNLQGYAHHTWLMVEGFATREFDKKYIQIKSFLKYSDAASYVRNSPIKLKAFLATNGWYAISLAEPVSSSMAVDLIKELKAQRLVPDDAFATYGNNYVKLACCQ
ncbi:SH3 domain-containing protein [Hoeflea sp. G2-23]|uniref:SH3 domain-containing protein n=1 Tax=Hoeflea algicola TaxID=2983763 RepID=A0ABT3Z4Z1_9HYPH|nr:SH3 domain-containing protein [Hoeflea algicola]MCY0146807.1 SH3 domain-containing protein [Hoeflea algicola]